jgi:hypothetical protein
MSRFFFLWAVLSLVAGCGSDSDEPAANGSEGSKDCATSPGDLAYFVKVAEEVGNGCDYSVSIEDEVVATGTCNLGGLIQNVEPANGAANLNLMGQVQPGEDDSGLYKNFQMTVGFADGWEGKAGVTFAASLSYVHAPEAPSTSNAVALTNDPEYLSVECGVGSVSGGQTNSGTIDSVRDACLFGVNEQFEVHGSLDATCGGLAGSPDPSARPQLVSIQVAF